MHINQQTSNKNFLCAAVLACMLVAPSFAWAKKLSDKVVFDPNRILEVEIELPDSDWRALCRQTRSFATLFSGETTAKPFNYFRGTVTVNGKMIPSVGIRRKGLFGSQDSERPSLKIKFDEFVKQDPAKGFDRLTLNNNKQDESQLSQFLAYRMFNAVGVHAPRVSFAAVTVNGEYLGIYSNVESIRRPFLKKRFGDDSGNLYEGTLTDFYIKSIERMEAKTNKKNHDRSRIEALAKLISSEDELPLAKIEELVDLDSFLRFWAMEGLIGFWDGYSSNQNNYFVYNHPQDDRLRFIPWGADSTFTTTNPLSRFGRGFASTSNSVYAQGMLANRLYRAPGMSDRYRQTMRMILKEHWNEKELLADVDRAEELIDGFLHERQDRAFGAIKDIRNFIRDRREVIEKELADENWPVEIPSKPRTPTYIVVVGEAEGEFAAKWRGKDSSQDDSSSAFDNLKVALDGKAIQFKSVKVVAELGQRPSSGFGQPNNAGPLPASIVISAEQMDGKPLKLTLNAPQTEFKPGAVIEVQGSISAGASRGGFGGFGGFGGSRRRLRGQLKLMQASLKDGAPVSGRIKLEVVESRGGLFGARR